MSDDVKAVDTAGEGSDESKQRNIDFEALKKERDEAKKRLREIEKAEEARLAEEKKRVEQQQIEQGKTKEVLESTRKDLEAEKLKTQELAEKAAAYEKQQADLRTQLLEKIPDEDIRSIAVNLPLADVQKLVDKLTTEKPQTASPKLKLGDPEDIRKNFKNAKEFGEYLKKQNLAV